MIVENKKITSFEKIIRTTSFLIAFSAYLILCFIIILIIYPISRINTQRALSFFTLLTLRTVFREIKIYGKENCPPHPAIYVSNHISIVDPFILYTTVKPIKKFVISSTVFSRNPAVGAIAWISGHIFTGARDTVRLAEKALKNKDAIIIYPEGTSGNKRIGRFHKGYQVISERAQVPIIPIALTGCHRSILKNCGLRMRVIIGKPIPPGGFARNAIVQLIADESGKDPSTIADMRYPENTDPTTKGKANATTNAPQNISRSNSSYMPSDNTPSSTQRPESE